MGAHAGARHGPGPQCRLDLHPDPAHHDRGLRRAVGRFRGAGGGCRLYAQDFGMAAGISGRAQQGSAQALDLRLYPCPGGDERGPAEPLLLLLPQFLLPAETVPSGRRPDHISASIGIPSAAHADCAQPQAAPRAVPDPGLGGGAVLQAPLPACRSGLRFSAGCLPEAFIRTASAREWIRTRSWMRSSWADRAGRPGSRRRRRRSSHPGRRCCRLP